MNTDISIENLNKILEVIKHNSISKAAESLDVNISTIRRAIKDVELQLNETLFQRAGNSLKIYPAALMIKEQHEKIIEKYTELVQNTSETLNSESNILNILCQPGQVRVFASLIKDNPDNFENVNIEAFSEFETINADPRTTSLIYEQFDCILTDTDIHLINEFNWKLSFEEDIPSHFYTTPGYLKEHGEINIKNLNQHNVFIKSFIKNDDITLFLESDKSVKTKVSLSSSIESDAIISNIEFAKKGHGVVEIPSYLKKFINLDNLVRIDDIYALPRKLMFYNKASLGTHKSQMIALMANSIRNNICT